jgi:hypothetical protein
MKRVNTGSKTKKDPESRINKALRKWNCKCGSADNAAPGLNGAPTREIKSAANFFGYAVISRNYPLRADA